MIGSDMRPLPPSRKTLRPAGREHGKPAAALAIIATIFATALVIKLLPPATRQAIVQITTRNLPARTVSIWAESPVAVSPHHLAVAAPTPLEARPLSISVAPAPIEPAMVFQLTVDRKPAETPLLPAASFTLVGLPMEVPAVPAETEVEASGSSPLVFPFAKTGSALRVAFVKTGTAIKAAASGTAGVFVPNP